MSNKRTFEAFDPILEYNKTCHNLRAKYYNLFRANFKWKGIDYRQEEFIMKQLWSKGTVAAFRIKGIDEIGFAPWTVCRYDMYGEPETAVLTNMWGSPLIPTSEQSIDKDVVIGWIQSNRKPFSMVVEWYIRRLAQIEQVININLNIHKMPFIIPVEDAKQKDKIADVINRILAGELVITMEGIDPALFNCVETKAPYIIDKLKNYYQTLENELKTYMGINNPGVSKIEQLQLSEVTANDGEIMDYDSDFSSCIESFCDRIKKTLGKEISCEIERDPLMIESEKRSYDKAPGPKGGQEDVD